MAKKPRTPAQLANDERLRKTPVNENNTPATPSEVAPDDNTDDLKRRIKEMETNQELMLQILKQNKSTDGVLMGSQGKLLGEVEKYTVDPDNYPDLTIRLRQEPRLQPLAFDYNYDLIFSMSVSSYETKTGANFKEPKFTIQLNKISIDDEGKQTDKRYVIKRLIFHEDPQAAIVVARENGISLDDYKDMDNTTENQRVFLNEMRYLRARDWLFGVFWPKAAETAGMTHEEVLDGTIVQTFSKPVGEAGGLDFDKLKETAQF